MSLIELPSNTGKVFAVNPHHVTSVTPYRSTMAGRVGMVDMCILRLAGDTTALYVCAWSLEDTLEVLNMSRRAEMDAFQAGFAACDAAVAQGEVPTAQHLVSGFASYTGKAVPA